MKFSRRTRRLFAITALFGAWIRNWRQLLMSRNAAAVISSSSPRFNMVLVAAAPSKNATREETASNSSGKIVHHREGRKGGGGGGGEDAVIPAGRPVIDILSIGSMRRPELQQTQQRVFESHAAVRHFIAITERNDTEADCAGQLTADLVVQVSHFCRNRPRSSELRQKFTVEYAQPKWLLAKAAPMAWLCAQKRPVDGLRLALQQYQYAQTSSSFPEYLILVDDDTWLNLPVLVPALVSSYEPMVPRAVAGCLVRKPLHIHKFTFPFGGWGTILTQATLRRWVRPIECSSTNATAQSFAATDVNNDDDDSDDAFVRHVCVQLARNMIGEARHFVNGMTLLDVMTAYTFAYPYLNVTQWQHPGFCLHSDWVTGYFVNYYHLAAHSGSSRFHNVHQDRLIGWHDAEQYGAKRRGQCQFDSDRACPPAAAICHYVSAGHMQRLHMRAMQHSQS